MKTSKLDNKAINSEKLVSINRLNYITTTIAYLSVPLIFDKDAFFR